MYRYTTVCVCLLNFMGVFHFRDSSRDNDPYHSSISKEDSNARERQDNALARARARAVEHDKNTTGATRKYLCDADLARDTRARFDFQLAASTCR